LSWIASQSAGNKAASSLSTFSVADAIPRLVFSFDFLQGYQFIVFFFAMS
jgi:hypothetical protein